MSRELPTYEIQISVSDLDRLILNLIMLRNSKSWETIQVLTFELDEIVFKFIIKRP